jgi:hypothetical protein
MDGSDLGLKGKPLSFQKCYLGDVQPPPGGITPITEPILAENPSIILEAQDIEAAIREGAAANPANIHSREVMATYAANPEYGKLRYYMHPKDARQLTCGLIYALADMDDRVAKRLAEVLDEMYAQGPTMGFEEEENG